MNDDDFPYNPDDNLDPLHPDRYGHNVPPNDDGHFPHEPDPRKVNNLEGAVLLRAARNATRTLVNREADVRWLRGGVISARRRVQGALEEMASFHRRRRLVEANEYIADLERDFSGIPAKSRQAPPLYYRLIAVVAVLMIAAIETWFLYEVALDLLRVEPGEWHGALGLCLGMLLAVVLWACGRLLAEAVWDIRSAPARAATGPGREDPAPWHWRLRQAAGRAVNRGPGWLKALVGVIAIMWMANVFGMLAAYRAGSQEGMPIILAEPDVILLIVTLALGAVLLESLVHNPYAAKMKKARRRLDAEIHVFEEQCRKALDALAELDTAHSDMRSKCAALQGVAREETDRAWDSYILVSRHRHGMHGPEAPEPRTRAEEDGEKAPVGPPGADAFQRFDGLRQPDPDLGVLDEAWRFIRFHDPSPLRQRYEELVAQLRDDLPVPASDPREHSDAV